jgi:hypothetical protein
LEGVGPENHIKLTTCNTEYRIQVTPAAKLMNIKLPMYLFFIWRLDLMIFMLAISITLANGRDGPSKWIFTHKNHYLPRHINNRYISSYSFRPPAQKVVKHDKVFFLKLFIRGCDLDIELESQLCENLYC